MAEPLPDPAGGPDIAIVGMVGRFPGARDVGEYWRNIRAGKSAVKRLDDVELDRLGVTAEERQDPRFVPFVSPLDGFDEFDAAFFGYSPREAELMDPQQRVFLQCCYAALEDAGVRPDAFAGRIGVFAGATSSTYLLLNLSSRPELVSSGAGYQTFVGNTGHSIATRVSYKLNLRGPSFAVQSACSTSLLAAHLACQSLLSEECDLALAGGVSINLAYRGGYPYMEGSILSPDGSCNPFDARARGTVFGSGAGVVVLRRLSDALADGDCIRAVIRGSAVANDGRLKAGFSAPSVDGQAAAITEALSLSGLSADEIGYLEAHGTGTSLGDPIEIQALTQAFRASTRKKGFCAIGSVKAIVGHLDAAAGVAGLIKAVLCLQHRELPPNPGFETANPQIDFAASPVYVNRALQPWPSGGKPRRAGVSSFGLGGTNVHAVLEEAPAAPVSPARSRSHELIVLSARTHEALQTATANLAEHLRQNSSADLREVAFTLQTGRQAFRHRRIAIAGDAAQAARVLEGGDPAWPLITGEADDQREPPVAFLFPGHGAQYVGMGRSLYRTERAFREALDESAKVLEPLLGLDLRKLLFADEAQAAQAAPILNEMRVAQPALFAVEHALARLWIDWGVRPEACLGHSVGEYVAACVAGVFTPAAAATLIATRGRLMQGTPAGAMMAVALGSEELAAFLPMDRLALAAINEKNQCVVSGAIEAVDEAGRLLVERGITCKRLEVSCASHSPLMDSILAPFRAEVAKARPQPPKLKLVSNVTGTWMTAEEAIDPSYWSRHLRGTVRFAQGLATLREAPGRVLLEVGPGQGLSGIARRAGVRAVASSMPPVAQRSQEAATVLQGLGQLWVAGVTPDWTKVHAPERPRRTPLPTYPFEQRRFWVEAPRRQGARALAEAGEPRRARQPLHPRPGLDEGCVEPRSDLERELAGLWQDLLGLDSVGALDNFFLVGGDSLLATQLASRLRVLHGVEVPLQRLLESPTVASMACLVVTTLAAKAEPGRLAELLEEVKRLDPGQLEAALADLGPGSAAP